MGTVGSVENNTAELDIDEQTLEHKIIGVVWLIVRRDGKGDL